MMMMMKMMLKMCASWPQPSACTFLAEGKRDSRGNSRLVNAPYERLLQTPPAARPSLLLTPTTLEVERPLNPSVTAHERGNHYVCSCPGCASSVLDFLPRFLLRLIPAFGSVGLSETKICMSLFFATKWNEKELKREKKKKWKLWNCKGALVQIRILLSESLFWGNVFAFFFLSCKKSTLNIIFLVICQIDFPK